MREGGAGAPRPSFLACGWLPVCVCGIAREEGERREEGGGDVAMTMMEEGRT